MHQFIEIIIHGGNVDGLWLGIGSGLCNHGFNDRPVAAVLVLTWQAHIPVIAGFAKINAVIPVTRVVRVTLHGFRTQ
ncbi:Uncharacterised protein [Vibrio cholerae]|nr:Uncharacterised protein [Vibrio cholerae]CSC00608.1 Uncharacterised protein [Vibrio cholerae]CSI75664.1 Uncharacterised protein [Vibrio cholerae]